MDKPYVVSADIQLLLRKWALQRGFALPSDEFFSELRGKFVEFMKQIFPNFEFVSEKELLEGISELLVENTLPVVSLDRVYSHSELAFEIARLSDEHGNDYGLGHRAGTPSILHQLRHVKKSGNTEVALIDDVIFSGSLIERVIDLFEKVGIHVPVVYAGISIVEGIKRTEKRCEVRSVRIYEQVIDEICERDFYPGVPLSGRLLTGGEDVGIPYLLPFGHPGKWASVPDEWQKPFSRFCIQQTIFLFEAIEECSGKDVCCADLERKVIGLPTNSARFVIALRKCF
ncbi:MAG: hypothetical protein PHN89_04045 [Candidatus Pacebacteria bacterium]|nr:hypothetical protein [Candidatus Paceibacterota bacterium]